MFSIIAFLKNGNIYAQSDSVKVEYKQESIDSSSFTNKFKYKYLDIKLKEEKNLLKIGIRPLSLELKERNVSINTYVIFEKKISPEWSVIFENAFVYEHFNSVEQFSNSIDLGTRYYYGMKKAIQKKISGNNFNRNYFELMAYGIPSIDNMIEKRQDGTFYQASGCRYSLFNSAAISWGIQRRLNNYTFFDTKISAGYNFKTNKHYDEGLFVGVSFIIGFGWNIKH